MTGVQTCALPILNQTGCEQGLNLRHSLFDLQAALPALIGSRGLPTTLFYDASSTLQDTHAGELSRATLAQGLARILPQE